MKTILLMSLLLSGKLFASMINLNLGDTITLQANTTNNSAEECLQQIWPSFKKVNPQCVNEGFNTCLNFQPKISIVWRFASNCTNDRLFKSFSFE